ncbi:MAG: ribosome assembly RNA-binding protein YhbY [Clostridia bacterium]|nr:ribosome assembly RNA-binding protein YhbY [Clostridia bacterium]
MTSKQRAYLRSMATSIQPIFQVGKGEISENMTEQISNALEARELIKVKVLENSLYTAREAAEIIAEETEAEVVTVIGNKFVLYRESEKHKKIDLSAV